MAGRAATVDAGTPSGRQTPLNRAPLAEGRLLADQPRGSAQGWHSDHGRSTTGGWRATSRTSNASTW